MRRTSLIRRQHAPFRIVAAILCLLPACSSRTSAPTAPNGGRESRLAQRAGSSLCLTLQDGIIVDGLLVVWRAKAPEQEAAIERDYDLETIDTVEGFRISECATGRFGGTLLDQLRADPRVLSAEPNFVADTPEAAGHSWAFDDGVLDGSGYEDQSASARLGLTAAQGVTRGGGILVAVLDTGVNGDNPLLAGRVVPGRDFVDDDTDATDLPDGVDSDADGLVDEALGHGTHVAGIVALVAPDARILPIRVLDNDGRGSLFAVARAISYAVYRGARVINLSFGSLASSELLQTVIDTATDQGVVVVASAGNWGADLPLEYPANSSHVIAVAATDPTDAPAPFTSFGPYVGICAPGVGIRSSYWNGHTALWSGTSMSTAFASGGAALLLATHPQWRWSDVLGRLAETAEPLVRVDGTFPSLTAGRLYLPAALGVAAAVPPAASSPAPSDSTSSGDPAPPPPDGGTASTPPDSSATTSGSPDGGGTTTPPDSSDATTASN